MNWDALGAFGEIIGAAAVVISVGYLAVQIRKQTEESRLSATRELASDFHSALDLLVQDKELVSIWGKGVQDYLGLPDDDRLRVSFFLQRITRVLEAQHLHLRNANVDPVYFESVRLAFFEGLTFPGYQQWWELSKGLFEPSFRDRVEEMLIEARQQGYESSFKSSGTQTPGEPA